MERVCVILNKDRITDETRFTSQSRDLQGVEVMVSVCSYLWFWNGKMDKKSCFDYLAEPWRQERNRVVMKPQHQFWTTGTDDVTGRTLQKEKMLRGQRKPIFQDLSVAFVKAQFIVTLQLKQGDTHALTVQVMRKKRGFIRPGHHCSVVQFWCSHAHCSDFWGWIGVSMGPLRSYLWCTVFCHLSIRTSSNFSSDLCDSSFSVGWDNTGKPSLHTCISEPWGPMTLSLGVHGMFTCCVTSLQF